MTPDKTIYIVDYENVGSKGIEGVSAKSLGTNSHVHLFYTIKSAKLHLDSFASLSSVNLHMHKISEGNQSVDMHMCAYLGLQMGKHGPACRYVIVSKDKGFDRIIQYLKTECGIEATRVETLLAVSKQTKAKAIVRVSNKPPQKVISSKERTELNNSIMKELGKSLLGPKVAGEVASTVLRLRSKGEGKQAVYHTLVAKYGQQRGLDIYSRIKQLI